MMLMHQMACRYAEMLYVFGVYGAAPRGRR